MVTKYQAIIEYIMHLAARDELKAGDRLPSIREMAQRFKCNKSTAIRAYAELEKEHAVYAIPQSGYYLVGRKDGVKHSGVETFDFASAGPAVEFLPYREFQHCMNQAIDAYRQELFNYGLPQGLPALRKVLARTFQNSQVFASEEQVMITTGSQQALEILVGMEFPNGKQNVLVEQPTYAGLIGACRQLGVKVMGVERGWDGIDLENLERIFRNGNIKFFYTIPRLHNPSGTSLTTQVKREILKLAQTYDVYIVEDDYLADLEVDTKSDPIYAFDRSSRVVYIKSYSKTLMPGLRLGAAVLPPLLLNTYKERKRTSDLGSSTITQAALEIFISSGIYQSHIQRIKGLYKERMNHLELLFDEILPGLRRSNPTTGLFMAVQLPCRAKTFCQTLLGRNILVTDVDQMRLPEFRRDDQIRLSITRVDSALMKAGVCGIAEALQGLNERRINGQRQNEVEVL